MVVFPSAKDYEGRKDRGLGRDNKVRRALTNTSFWRRVGRVLGERLDRGECPVLAEGCKET